LVYFTSGIPDCRRYDMWKTEHSLSPNQGTVSPCRSNHGGWQTRLGSAGGKGVRLLGSQTHVLHPKGVEHIPQHRLFFRCEIAFGLVFQDREQVDNVFRLR
jgi:hypothetical protein